MGVYRVFAHIYEYIYILLIKQGFVFIMKDLKICSKLQASNIEKV